MAILSEEKWAKILGELDFQFSRSSGPGGQHVNKTESRAELRWNLNTTTALTEFQTQRVRRQLENLISRSGHLRITAEEYRSRDHNRELCLEKLKFLVAQALHVPKKRIKTKPSRSSVKKRIESKKRRGQTKKNRQKPE